MISGRSARWQFARSLSGWRAVALTGLVVVGFLVSAGRTSAEPPFTPVDGSPFAAGVEPVSVAFSWDGSLLATANHGGGADEPPPGELSVFLVGSDGGLTQVSGSPFRTGDEPLSVAFPTSFSRSDVLVANTNERGSVSVFSAETAGPLTPASGSPFRTGRGPASVAFSDDNKWLATADNGSQNGQVSVFRVGSGGALTPVKDSPFPTGKYTRPVSVAFEPEHDDLLATANSGGNSVSVFEVMGAGRLRQVDGSPFRAGREPASVAFHPNGKLLAAANRQADSVSVFAVRSGGALKQVSQSPFPTGLRPRSVAFSQDGNLLATANSGAVRHGDNCSHEEEELDQCPREVSRPGTVSVFSVGADGDLTELSDSPLRTGGRPQSVAFSRTGQLAIANAEGNNVAVYAPSSP
jgi:6-phosphogluconolactonase (cycloisomerase 2 family)